ncbi:MAG: hypothetical protein ACPGNV_07090 [Mangrovicoccus sp.]
MAWKVRREISAGEILVVVLPAFGVVAAVVFWFVEPWRERVSYYFHPEEVEIKFIYDSNPDPDVPLQVSTSITPSGKRKILTEGTITWTLNLLTPGRILSEKNMSVNFPSITGPRIFPLPEPVVIHSDEITSNLEIIAKVSTRQTEKFLGPKEITLTRSVDRRAVSSSNYTGVWQANFGDDLSEMGVLRLIDTGPEKISGKIIFPNSMENGQIIDVIGSRDGGLLHIKGELKDGCSITYNDTGVELDEGKGVIKSQSLIEFGCSEDSIKARFWANLLSK